MDTYFFGYGSLVNRATHSYPGAHPARLNGWRRVWRHTTLRDVAFLTVRPDPTTAIDGLIAELPNQDWAALDAREWAYDRLDARGAVDHPLPTELDIAVYAVPDHAQSPPSDRHPIIMSYLDVVVQGYLREFGADGATAFFDTTDGWDAPILNDRAEPRYPRAQELTASETAFVDDALATVLEQLDQPGAL